MGMPTPRAMAAARMANGMAQRKGITLVTTQLQAIQEAVNRALSMAIEATNVPAEDIDRIESMSGLCIATLLDDLLLISYELDVAVAAPEVAASISTEQQLIEVLQERFPVTDGAPLGA